jgi:nucleotide-binding universal stress UspA family protein
MKILAAVDFSAASMNAARCAIRLARKLGDSVLLARVVGPPTLAYPLRGSDRAAFIVHPPVR